MREADSISGENSIETHLKLGSSITYTPNKNTKGRSLLRNLKSNIDYDIDNITAKSNSFNSKPKRFEMHKVPASSEQDFLTDPNEAILKKIKKDEVMTPKSAKINKNHKQGSMKVTSSQNERNTLSLSISKNNSVALGETPISKSLSNQKKDSGSESNDDFTRYFRRNTNDKQRLT